MHDNCNPDSCPVNAKVDALENRFNRFETDAKEFHEKIDVRVKDQETLAAVQDQKLDDIKAGQKDMTAKLDILMGKPGKMWDGTVRDVLKFIIEAVLVVVAVKVGLM